MSRITLIAAPGASGFITSPLMLPGYYYTTAGSTSTAGAMVDKQINWLSILLPGSQAFDRIGVDVTATGSGTARLGIYSDTGGGFPKHVLLDAGTVSLGSLGLKQLTISFTTGTRPNWYWLACYIQNAGATTPNIQIGGIPADEVLAAANQPGGNVGYRALNVVTAGLPDPPPGTIAETNAPSRVFLRTA